MNIGHLKLEVEDITNAFLIQTSSHFYYVPEMRAISGGGSCQVHLPFKKVPPMQSPLANTIQCIKIFVYSIFFLQHKRMYFKRNFKDLNMNRFVSGKLVNVKTRITS